MAIALRLELRVNAVESGIGSELNYDGWTAFVSRTTPAQKKSLRGALHKNADDRFAAVRRRVTSEPPGIIAVNNQQPQYSHDRPYLPRHLPHHRRTDRAFRSYIATLDRGPVRVDRWRIVDRRANGSQDPT